MYLFEHLLLRLEKSPYAEKFVLKGGLLIASMIGVSLRTTMDMDTTVVGMSLDRANIERAIKDICGVDVGDEMEYILNVSSLFEPMMNMRTGVLMFGLDTEE